MRLDTEHGADLRWEGGRVDVRTVITGLVAGVRPGDAREAADQAGILAWLHPPEAGPPAVG